jgi:hypothetical protein
MDHFAGLDVSVKESSVCIVDGTGRIWREVKVASGHWLKQRCSKSAKLIRQRAHVLSCAS